MTILPARYCLQQEPNTDRWVIVCARDPDLVWQGWCWTSRDRLTGTRLTFGSVAEAEAYAAQVFSERSPHA